MYKRQGQSFHQGRGLRGRFLSLLHGDDVAVFCGGVLLDQYLVGDAGGYGVVAVGDGKIHVLQGARHLGGFGFNDPDLMGIVRDRCV